MPRFTIGSIVAGVTLFVLAIAAWTVWTERQKAAATATRTATPDGRMVVANVDPRSGTVVLDGPSDLGLEDADPWDGGLTAATW